MRFFINSHGAQNETNGQWTVDNGELKNGNENFSQ